MSGVLKFTGSLRGKAVVANVGQGALCGQLAFHWIWGPAWLWGLCAALSFSDAVSAWRHREEVPDAA